MADQVEITRLRRHGKLSLIAILNSAASRDPLRRRAVKSQVRSREPVS